MNESDKQAEPVPPITSAEDYLRGKYGAYRGHFAWRELEEAFNAGRQAQPVQPNCGACPGDGTVCRISCRLADESPSTQPVQPAKLKGDGNE